MTARSLRLAFLAWLLLPVHAFAIEIPPNDGFMTDFGGLLTTDQELDIEQRLSQYRDATSNEIAVVTVPRLEGEAAVDVAVEIGRAWGVGGSDDDNGILMLISYEDRELFIATGYGLEGAVPDLVAKGIIDQDITPEFREARYYEGILAGIDALQKHIGGEYTADRYAVEEGDGPWPFLLFIGFIFLQALAGMLAHSKSWWQGGVIGGVFGAILTVAFAWWWTVPVLVLFGLLFDYIVSKKGPGRGGRGGRGGPWMGGSGSSGGGGGGGFGGFGGGSFGGGGAGGKW